MMFLVSSSTFVDHGFGIMATPSLAQNYAGIDAGMSWAADNEAFAGKFDADRFFPWLERLERWKSTCLFVTVPDVVGDAAATLEKFDVLSQWMLDWPVAYVAQDGSEYRPIPECACVFIGGTTEWKMGPGALRIIGRAMGRGKRIHIGRVNFWKRYRHFSGIGGSNEWTCDGTRNRFEGLANSVADWQKCMDSPSEPYLPIPERDSVSESIGGVAGAKGDDSQRLPVDRA